MRRSPLHGRHLALAARMGGFAGWEMPLDYGSVLAEHRAVREHCGAFDLSHLGMLTVVGERAGDVVAAAFTNDARSLAVGRAHYALCLDEAGGVVDDLLVYRLGWGFFVVPNAANAAAVRTLLERLAARSSHCEVADGSGGLACVAVQGPRAADVLARAGVRVDGLRYLDCEVFGAVDVPPPGTGVLARSGYTGERGYELFAPVAAAGGLWDRIVEAGAAPAGLGARDTLRLEMGYPLHGQELSTQVCPLEAGLGWAVSSAAGFRGRAAYLEAVERGATRRLWGLRAEGKGVPRSHCSVRRGPDVVGETTSGTFSPTLRVGIALAYLDPGVSPGDHVEIDVRTRAIPAVVVRPPFITANPKA